MSSYGTTQPVRVEVLLVGPRIITGSIHLQPLAQHHGGAETPVDYMNRPELFFAVTLEGEQPLFVARSQVLYVKLPADSPFDDPDRVSAARRIEFEIELADGQLVDGVAALDVPPHRPRALDFLNSAPNFFTVRTRDAVWIVNRDHVRAVSPLVDLSRAPS
jgi:hypothetical protein